MPRSRSIDSSILDMDISTAKDKDNCNDNYNYNDNDNYNVVKIKSKSNKTRDNYNYNYNDNDNDNSNNTIRTSNKSCSSKNDDLDGVSSVDTETTMPSRYDDAEYYEEEIEELSTGPPSSSRRHGQNKVKVNSISSSSGSGSGSSGNGNTIEKQPKQKQPKQKQKRRTRSHSQKRGRRPRSKVAEGDDKDRSTKTESSTRSSKSRSSRGGSRKPSKRTSATSTCTNASNSNSNSNSNNAAGKSEESTVKRIGSPGTKKNIRKGRPIPFVRIAVVMVFATIGWSTMGFWGILHTKSPASKSSQSQSQSQSSPSSSEKSPERTGAVASRPSKEILDKVREEFNERYKVPSKIDGNQLLERGLHSFGSIDHTALRILQASKAKRPFVMAFSGYSITVGRGNFYNQSFPFVTERILQEPMQKLFDIPIVVRNAAIGGIPSFPYGFCLDHFLGSDPDVISWDYSMNEKQMDAGVLEAFLRQATKQLPKRPMVIMMDTNANRMRTLEEYTRNGWLKDAIAIANKDILKKSNIFEGDAKALPAGFQDWDEFGAPKRCPGRGSWHPKRQEHAMMGWVIAMHFIEAMDRAIILLEKEPNHGELSMEMPALGKPISKPSVKNDPEVTELLFGHPDKNDDDYRMKELSCRTSFLPATDHEKTLKSVVVSGLAEVDLDIMVDRTDDHYKEGWVLDVSKIERDTKRKVESCGGLGYVDMKIAMYGIPDSGKLRLWLPFEGPLHDHAHHGHGDDHALDTNAKHWFDDFIICEANEKRDKQACQLDRDLEIIVGGVPVENIHMVEEAAEYLKRPTCVNVGVPQAAKITTLGDLRTSDGQTLSGDEKRKFGRSYGDDAFGLVVDVTVKSGVTRKNGACCLSHIIWEQH